MVERVFLLDRKSAGKEARLPDLLVTPRADLSTKLIPRLQALRQESNGREVIGADYPAFPIRGIVEGLYGPPWSYSDRLDVIRFEGQHGMNIYICGPKDNPLSPQAVARAVSGRAVAAVRRAGSAGKCLDWLNHRFVAARRDLRAERPNRRFWLHWVNAGAVPRAAKSWAHSTPPGRPRNAARTRS
jgi:hypothetical protein